MKWVGVEVGQSGGGGDTFMPVPDTVSGKKMKYFGKDLCHWKFLSET